MESLTWTFKEQHEYECSIAGRVTVQEAMVSPKTAQNPWYAHLPPKQRQQFTTFKRFTENDDWYLKQRPLVLHLNPLAKMKF